MNDWLFIRLQRFKTIGSPKLGVFRRRRACERSAPVNLPRRSAANCMIDLGVVYTKNIHHWTSKFKSLFYKFCCMFQLSYGRSEAPPDQLPPFCQLTLASATMPTSIASILSDVIVVSECFVSLLYYISTPDALFRADRGTTFWNLTELILVCPPKGIEPVLHNGRLSHRAPLDWNNSEVFCHLSIENYIKWKFQDDSLCLQNKLTFNRTD